MPAEIERKFLLTEPPSQLEGSKSRPIEQGYLAISEDAEVRLRADGEKRLLTVKGGRGETREETEVELPVDVFDELWPQTSGLRVEKTRHLVPLDDDLTAEVDVYSGDLEGLVVVEVEFESGELSKNFEAPDWLGEEVTGDHRYANQSLAADGVPE
jgi:adenylate cyclase